MAYIKKDRNSKKARYVRLFEEAMPRLERGEIVFLVMEQSLGMQTLTDERTLRVYWTDWRKAQAFVDPSRSWLASVRLTHLQQEGRYVMQLVRREVVQRLGFGEWEKPLTTVLVTGREASIAQGGTMRLDMPQETARLADERTDRQAKWRNWVMAKQHDPMEHLEAFALAFDSPEAVAYRAQHGD